MALCWLYDQLHGLNGLPSGCFYSRIMRRLREIETPIHRCFMLTSSPCQSVVPKTIADARKRVLALPPMQQRIFLLLCSYWAANDQLPGSQAIADHMGYRSTNAAYDVLTVLQAKGLLERNASQRLRFCRVEGISLGELFRDGLCAQSASMQ